MCTTCFEKSPVYYPVYYTERLNLPRGFKLWLVQPVHNIAPAARGLPPLVAVSAMQATSSSVLSRGRKRSTHWEMLNASMSYIRVEFAGMTTLPAELT